MPTVRESRVYVAKSGTATAYVATGLGVAAVRISEDKVGEFSLAERCSARDVARTAHGVAAATDDEVLLAGDDGFESIGLGAAVAVTALDGDVLAATDDGRLCRYDGEWTEIAAVDAEVRALDGNLVATGDGVHRLTDDGLAPAGLEDAWDVASAGVPHAATPDALYRLGNGWMAQREGAFATVTSDPATASAGELGRAHAATADTLYEYAASEGGTPDAAWTPRDLPVEESVVDVAYVADATIALTEPGTVLVDAGDGFRHRRLGLRDARALAVVGEGNA
jgi:hypothetical protein